MLSKGHLRCPWHGACFNIATGDIEDFPGLDSLPTFQVTPNYEPSLTTFHPVIVSLSAHTAHVCLLQVRVEKDRVIIRANKQVKPPRMWRTNAGVNL